MLAVGASVYVPREHGIPVVWQSLVSDMVGAARSVSLGEIPTRKAPAVDTVGRSAGSHPIWARSPSKERILPAFDPAVRFVERIGCRLELAAGSLGHRVHAERLYAGREQLARRMARVQSSYRSQVPVARPVSASPVPLEFKRHPDSGPGSGPGIWSGSGIGSGHLKVTRRLDLDGLLNSLVLQGEPGQPWPGKAPMGAAADRESAVGPRSTKGGAATTEPATAGGDSNQVSTSVLAHTSAVTTNRSAVPR